MLKVVLDTNVIVSGAITDHGAAFQALRKWEENEFILVVSEPILEEIERVLHYPKIKKKRHLSEERIRNILALLKKYSMSTPADIAIEAVPEDPTDNKFVIAAVEAEVDYIVSGDQHLRNLGSYCGIGIVSPDEFLRIL